MCLELAESFHRLPTTRPWALELKNNGLFKGELKWDLTKKNKLSNNPKKLEVTDGFKILNLQALFPWMPKDFYISLALGDRSRKCSSNDFMASSLQAWR